MHDSPARPAWFIAVGCAAAAVHWTSAVLAVEGLGWHPLVANVGGWLAALGLSFAGHHRLTFRGHGAPVWRSAARFLLLSASGFAVNETAYALALGRTGLGYRSLLATVLVAVAFITWLVSRHWVFRGTPARR